MNQQVSPSPYNIPIINDHLFDLEKVVPMEAIREHTRTDDVEVVSDHLIKIYRSAAVEAAEQYTGMTFSGQRVVEQHVEPFRSKRPTWSYNEMMPTPTSRKIRLEHPAARAEAWFRETPRSSSVQLEVTVGSNEIEVPITCEDMLGGNCCDTGCGSSYGGLLVYYVGFSDPRYIPANVMLGCLKYIAHVMENPGDIVKTTSTNGVRSNSNIHEAANPALASGAINHWQVLNPRFI